MTNLTTPTPADICRSSPHGFHKWADSRCVHCGQPDARFTAAFGKFFIETEAWKLAAPRRRP